MATTTYTASHQPSTTSKTAPIAAILGALAGLGTGVTAFIVSYGVFMRALTCKTAGLTTEVEMHLAIHDVEFYKARCLDGTTHTAWLPSTIGALGVALLTMLLLLGAARMIYLINHAVKITQPGYSGYHYPVISYHVDTIMYYLLWGALLALGAALILHNSLAGK